jgi:translation elongation factor EF-1alpha
MITGTFSSDAAVLVISAAEGEFEKGFSKDG